MIDANLISRIQFAFTAGFHFTFSGLTLGLSVILAICETIYVITGNAIWKESTKFWGMLFGVNFAIGAGTGLPLEFQFGTNWAQYSRCVSDIFGTVLALEGLVAFFAEATLIGIFFFGWNLMSKYAHLLCTWLLAIATNLSGLFILIANAWMQYPAGSKFNQELYKMELISFSDVFFSEVAQAKFAHTILAGYVYGSIFVIGISSFYILKDKFLLFAKKNILVSSIFGLVASLGLIIAGDESGRLEFKHQPLKLAAIEALWEAEEPPADFILFAIPSNKDKRNYYELKIPKLLGILVTRSTVEHIKGIKEIIKENEEKIRMGAVAYDALERLRIKEDPELRRMFEQNAEFFGFGLLLKDSLPEGANLSSATDADISRAAESMVPNVFSLFWAFRFMVGFGFYFLIFLAFFSYMSLKGKDYSKIFSYLAVATIPFPVIAVQLGWFVAEHGRQPWTIHEILPTCASGSIVDSTQVFFVFCGFIALYSVLFVVTMIGGLKVIKKGPKV